jgi:hypothetical protein
MPQQREGGHRPLFHVTHGKGVGGRIILRKLPYRGTRRRAVTQPTVQCCLYKKGNQSLHVKPVLLSETRSSLFFLRFSHMTRGDLGTGFDRPSSFLAITNSGSETTP